MPIPNPETTDNPFGVGGEVIENLAEIQAAEAAGETPPPPIKRPQYLDEAQGVIWGSLNGGTTNYPHASIYNVPGKNGLDVRGGSFYRLFNCPEIKYITLGEYTDVIMRDGCQMDGEIKGGNNSYLRIEECKLKKIENMTKCKIFILDCQTDEMEITGINDSRVYIKNAALVKEIKNCRNTRFILENVKTRDPFKISGCRECTFQVYEGNFDSEQVTQGNSECSYMFDNTNIAFKQTKTTFDTEGGATFLLKEPSFSTTASTGSPNYGFKINTESFFISHGTTGRVPRLLGDMRESSAALHDTELTSVDEGFIADQSSIGFADETSFTSQNMKQNILADFTYVEIFESELTSEKTNAEMTDGGIRLKASKLTADQDDNVKGTNLVFCESLESEMESSQGANVSSDIIYNVQNRRSKFTSGPSRRNYQIRKAYISRNYGNEFSNGLSGIPYFGPAGVPDMPLYVEFLNADVVLTNFTSAIIPAAALPVTISQTSRCEDPCELPEEAEEFRDCLRELGYEFNDDGYNIIGIEKSSGAGNSQTYSDEMVVIGNGDIQRYPASTNPGTDTARRILPGQQIDYEFGVRPREPNKKVLSPVAGSDFQVQSPDGTISKGNRTFQLHAGGNPGENVSTWSAGCQVVPLGGWNSPEYNNFIDQFAGAGPVKYTKITESELASCEGGGGGGGEG